MRRREFLLALGGLALPVPVLAQSQVPNPKLVIYSPSEPDDSIQENGPNIYYRILFSELRRLGHVDGKNLTVERYGKKRSAGGPEATVAEIVASKPDVIYVVAANLPLFKQATDKIPIIAMSGDPVREGLVKTLAHPGGNITGVSTTAEAGVTIHGKRIELLREIFPGLKQLAFITSKTQWDRQAPDVRVASDALGVTVTGHPVEIPGSEAAYRDAIANVKAEGANAIMIGSNADTFANRRVIADLISASGLPAIYPFADFVSVGGLIAYSFDLADLTRRVADDIHAVLSGTNPADIPFYQSSKFKLSVNLKTARALSLTVPATLLASAEDVIE